MASFTLDERTRLSIELALTAQSPDALRHQQQDAMAKALGMTGAEIDAARRGWSFDVQTSVAMALATTPRADDTQRQQQRARARRAGIPEMVCREIEDFASRFAPARDR